MRKIGSLVTLDQFLDYVRDIGADLPVDKAVEPAPDGPLAQTLHAADRTVGNRFAILPMEGWDGTAEGMPTGHTLRRWQRFGQSGAKLIWGGEAVAVRQDGRANPNQLLINDGTLSGLEQLRAVLIEAHRERFGRVDDLLIGLQLTHSGRFARPNDKRRLEPKILYHHPLLDPLFQIDDHLDPLSDEEIDRLVDQFIEASVLARRVGFDFVDLKHCHGYLGHEFLSSIDRPGKYGGSFENRTRFLRQVVGGIRDRVPDLHIGVRISLADTVPYRRSDSGVGCAASFENACYPYAFGGDGSGLEFDLSEPGQFLQLLSSLGISLVCTSLGSPYYNPHLQRPAWYPPSDGYLPPEDPLLGVARHLSVTAELKRRYPQLVFVGTGYSYLQQWLGHVAQGAVARSWVDSVGIGRMALSYPELPADLLAGRPLRKPLICRTFSDCTTAPRNGLISGCYPLDPYYRQLPEHQLLQQVKRSRH